MRKFTHELRMQVINERLLGKSFGQLAKKFNIGETTIKKWAHQYNAGGVTQLINVNRCYSTRSCMNIFIIIITTELSLN
jgi:transposase